jgi:hypothetical protein
MRTVFSEAIWCCYHSVVIAELGSGWDDMAASGQNNGICGSAIPNQIVLRFGPHTGRVHLTIAVTNKRPAIDRKWNEIVESSFEALDDLALHALSFDGDPQGPMIPVPEGNYRLRYSALDFSEPVSDEAAPQQYELILWPAKLAEDKVIKVSNPRAASYHHPKINYDRR